MLMYQGRLCVPNVNDFRDWSLEKAHGSHHSIYPGYKKIYHELTKIYWWEGFKWVITKFVAKCPNFKQVQAEYQKAAGLKNIQIPTLMWENINMDFAVGLSRTQKSNYSIWVVVDRLTMSAHFILFKYTYLREDYSRIIHI